MTQGDIQITVKGQVLKPGTYTAKRGENMLDVIFNHAGGMVESRFLLRAVLVGGPRGRFAAAADLSTALASPQELMVFDTGSCLVNLVRLLLTYNSSVAAGYGGCPACRRALAAGCDILARLSTSRGAAGDLAELERLASAVNPACPDRCSGLAPLASALNLWREEFAEHAAGRCRASICTELMLSPCSNSCPAGVDLPGTIALTQTGRYADAVALGRHDNPFFLTCGHVCEEPPCQKNCKRLSFDDAIYSQSLHRYAGEKAAKAAGGLGAALDHATIRPGGLSGKRVAVVGAGPAGLAAAYFLARLGHKVIVYDRNSWPGGMMTYGIPAYRLPRETVQAEIASIQALGVDIRTDCSLGREITLSGLRDQYDAVLLALGNGKGRALGIPGEDLPGVTSALDFLHQVADSGSAAVGRRVLVVGGGNVAVDAARTAKRLGAGFVTMMCVEDKFEMPASPGEIKAAEEEGITVRVLAVPLAIRGDGRAAGVAYTAIRPGPYDALGRRWPPEPLRETARAEEYDTVIIAIGQLTEFDGLVGSGLETTRSAIACLDGQTTNITGVFAAGDCAGSLNSVVKAVGSGKAAAFAIDRYLTGTNRALTSHLRSRLGCSEGEYAWAAARRVRMPEQDPVARVGNFAPVELGLDDSRAAAEMLRCVCAAKGGRQ